MIATEKRLHLTSAEIASTWTGYMNDSMSICLFSYFLKHIEDEHIRSIVQHAYDLSASHLEKLTALFQAENIPTPIGFSIEHDVHPDAPRLYTDSFVLAFIGHMARAGLLAYSGFVSMSARKDIRAYFMEGLAETTDLFDRTSEIAIEKGLFVKAPSIPYPQKIDTVDSNKYLSGYSFFNKKRPLNSIEISHLYMNIQTNIIGSKLALSFAQISPREDVQKWMLRGCEISKKHIQILGELLMADNVQPPGSSEISITDSTTPPFSDKLTLFHMSMLTSTGSGNYATSGAASQRSDLAINYERLALEVAQYAKDGADIMIANEWLEQPPGTSDKKKLVKTKE